MHYHLCLPKGKASAQPKAQGGLLVTARDWNLLGNLGSQLRFLDTITTTTLQPNLVLMSMTTKQVVLLKLTVPWEDQMEEAHERNPNPKYANRFPERQRKGCEPAEAGCRGFAGSVYLHIGFWES